MNSGGGRGRGWLQLNKGGPQKPGVLNIPHMSKLNIQDEEPYEQETKVPRFSELVRHVGVLDPKDDGIIFNQKVTFIVEEWNKLCKDPDDVRRSCVELFDAAYSDKKIARNFATLVSSNSFFRKSQTIQGVKIKEIFLLEIQKNFEDRENLRSQDDFSNRTLMFFTFIDATKIILLLSPLAQSCLDLLERNQEQDIKLGILILSKICEMAREKLEQLQDQRVTSTNSFRNTLQAIAQQIKLLLASDKVTDRSVRLWLLLGLDIISSDLMNKALSLEMYDFYKEQLLDDDLDDIVVAEHPSKNCRAPSEPAPPNVVLNEVTNHDSSSATGQKHKMGDLLRQCETENKYTPSFERNTFQRHDSDGGKLRNLFHRQDSDGYKQENHRIGNQNNCLPPKEKGRPILGVGARLQRNYNGHFPSSNDT